MNLPSLTRSLLAITLGVTASAGCSRTSRDRPAAADPASTPAIAPAKVLTTTPATVPRAVPPTAPVAKSGVGVVGLNLSTVNDWSREWTFVDAFKTSRPWALDGKEGPAADAAGSPKPADGRAAWTLVVRELEGHYPGGKYAVTWKGAGEVEVRRWDVTGVPRRSPGRVEADVKPANYGVQIDVKASDPADPVRDIHAWLPGFEDAKSPFHPLFLGRMGPAGVIRFMDWQRTNDSPLVRWADRAKPDDARYSTEKGVPVEVMVALANAKKADPWFCIPHKADDDFVREFARLVKRTLDPGRTVYLEYSNEVWNWQFPQTKWAREQGLARKLGDPDHGRFYAERAVQVFGIWEQEFGRDRLVRVLASQAAVPWLSEQIVTWKEAYKHADALAVAPYFGHAFGDAKTAAEVAKLSPGELLDRLEKEVDGENRDLIRKQAELAKKYKLRLVAYEGGQHLVGVGGAENDAALTKLFHAANRHPKMYDLYRKHLRHWAEAGGDAYVLFAYVAAPTKWGSWGLLEYQDQPAADAPKYRAFLDHGAAAGK